MSFPGVPNGKPRGAVAALDGQRKGNTEEIRTPFQSAICCPTGVPTKFGAPINKPSYMLGSSASGCSPNEKYGPDPMALRLGVEVLDGCGEAKSRFISNAFIGVGGESYARPSETLMSQLSEDNGTEYIPQPKSPGPLVRPNGSTLFGVLLAVIAYRLRPPRSSIGSRLSHLPVDEL